MVILIIFIIVSEIDLAVTLTLLSLPGSVLILPFFAIPMLLKLLPFGAFMWLLIGGIFYTVGGVVYALKLPLLEKYFKGFGAHELFHIFVMGGTFCHYMMMFLYLAN